MVQDTYGPKFLEEERALVAPGCEKLANKDELLEICTLEYIGDSVQENVEVPDLFLETGKRAVSVVSFTVGTDGRVEEASISTSARLDINEDSKIEYQATEASDKAALDVVKKLKFTIPEQSNGEPWKLTCKVPVVFTNN